MMFNQAFQKIEGTTSAAKTFLADNKRSGDMKSEKFYYGLATVILMIVLGSTSGLVAQKGAEIDKKADAAYATLLAGSPAATRISKESKAVLVFPSIKKAGFMIGGQYGEGSLRSSGKTMGYYKTTAASFGLQAGG